MREGRRDSGLTGVDAVVGTLFVGITALRLIVDDPNEGVTALYALPVAIAATRWSRRAALATAGFAVALFVAGTFVLDASVGPLGYATRAILLFGVAVLVNELAARTSGAAAGERRAAEHLGKVIETTHEAYVAMDREGVIAAWNREAERLFGWTAEEAVGRTVEETLVPERIRGKHRRGLGHYLRTGEGPVLNRRVELPALTRDGEEMPVEITISALEDDQAPTFHAFLHDIGDRRDAERAVRNLAAIVESSADAIAGVDLDGRITSWNEAAERLYGYTAAEAIGRHGSLVTYPDPEGRTDSMLDRIAGGQRIEGHETVHLRKDGSPVEVSLTMAPVFDAEGTVTGAAVIGRDIGERRRAEQEAERLKSEFFALVSHELRTPLTSIVGYADIIAEQELDRLSEQGQGFFEVIQRSTRRLDRIVQDLLLVAQVEAGTFHIQPGAVRIDALVRECAEELRPAAEEAGIALSTDAVPVTEFSGDANRLVQVVDNLVSNAIKFTPRGGRVEIRARERDGSCILEVADSGVGIGPDELQHLFDRFYRAGSARKGQIKGVGLGLAITKAIVEQHHGEIEIESELEEGTTFRVLLPIAPPPPAPGQDTGRQGAARSTA
jgi:two-component system, sensor histidine kinase and response regulator